MPPRNPRAPVLFERDKLEEQLKSGLSASQIARRRRCSVRTVMRAIHAHDLAKYLRQPIEITKALLDDLYTEQELSEAKIGEMLGCSACTVHRRLVEFGIARFSRGAPSGERAPNVKLTPEMIPQIRQWFHVERKTLDQIVAELGGIITKQGVFNIVHRKTWKHID